MLRLISHCEAALEADQWASMTFYKNTYRRFFTEHQIFGTGWEGFRSKWCITSFLRFRKKQGKHIFDKIGIKNDMKAVSMCFLRFQIEDMKTFF